VRVAHFDSQHSSDGSRNPHHNHKSDSLIRLYEAMDTPLIQPVASFTVTCFFAPLAKIACPKLLERETPQRAGRSPPQFKDDGAQYSLVTPRTLAA
jgi:hypothetical protein